MHEVEILHHDAAGQRDQVDLALQSPGRRRLGPALGERLLQDAVIRFPRRIVRHQPTSGLQGEARPLNGGR